MTNPLLDHSALPAFDRIQCAHIEVALDQVLADNRAAIAALLSEPDGYSWDGTLGPVEDLNDRLNRTWSPVSHLHSVADSDELREVYNRCLAKLSEYHTELGQNEQLCRAYEAVKQSDAFAGLDTARRKIIDNALRDFRLAGVRLGRKDKVRFKAVKQELSKSQTRYEENLLDATQAWKKHVEDPAFLHGLPDSARALARQLAEQEDKPGWLFSLDMPSYLPVMTYADRRDLRSQMYLAFATRASDQGPDAGRWDNTRVMAQILALRHESAELLGFTSYAEYSLETKMAKDPQEVLNFLNDLAHRSRPIAQGELNEVQAFALERDGLDVLEAWDVPYYSEKLRQHKYAISQEELRPYFPLPQVLQGLFKVAKRLFGMHVREVEGVAGWHDDVCFFGIYDADRRLRGSFYLDLYARPGKRGGAWMDECIVRKQAAHGVQDPVAYLTCNFTPPVGDQPALLTHMEVITLFHEFGHGLHHMLTLIDYPGVAGINGVAWDAVELPSQFLENWCWEYDALASISGHIDTGEPIGADLFERMHAAKGFQSGLQMLRQLEFALFDMHLHMLDSPPSGDEIQALLDDVRAQVSVIKVPAFNRFQHGFAHIFAGGYAAGYYSYKWAEVLAADAFSRFEENGVFDAGTGRDFLRCILEQGGSRDPLELFVDFRGREPSIEPLLRRSGILA